MKTTFNHIGGITAVLGGLYLLILSLLQVYYGSDLEDSGLFWQLLPLMALFLVIGAVGLLALVDGRSGIKVGIAVMGLGAILLALGFGLMVWFDNENGWATMMLGLLLQPLGFLLFGLFNWRARVLRRWNHIPILVGIICSILFGLAVLGGGSIGFSEQYSELAFGIYLLILAVGWTLLGISMLSGSRNSSLQSSAAA